MKVRVVGDYAELEHEAKLWKADKKEKEKCELKNYKYRELDIDKRVLIA